MMSQTSLRGREDPARNEKVARTRDTNARRATAGRPGLGLARRCPGVGAHYSILHPSQKGCFPLKWYCFRKKPLGFTKGGLHCFRYFRCIEASAAVHDGARTASDSAASWHAESRTGGEGWEGTLRGEPGPAPHTPCSWRKRVPQTERPLWPPTCTLLLRGGVWRESGETPLSLAEHGTPSAGPLQAASLSLSPVPCRWVSRLLHSRQAGRPG